MGGGVTRRQRVHCLFLVRERDAFAAPLSALAAGSLPMSRLRTAMLGPPRVCVEAAGEHQLVVPAPLRHAAVLQHDDLVDEFEGRKSMGYQHCRAIGGGQKEVWYERGGGGVGEIGGGVV